jgi:anti-sigma-K factor RskA
MQVQGLPHLMTNDDEIDGLAGEYVLGSLDPVERKEVAARRKVDVPLDAAIKAWEQRLGPLGDLLPGIAPPPHIFLDVKKRLSIQR